jgi:predicted outer membrane repeat protein
VAIYGQGTPHFQRCTIENNSSQSCGGGIACMAYMPYAESRLYLDACVFAGNVAVDALAEGGGGALACCEYSRWVVHATGCTFHGNSAPAGSAVYADHEASVIISRSIIASSEDGDVVTCAENGRVSLECCDVYDNEGGDWAGYLANQWGIEGNFWGDPGFCDAPNGDFSLQASSPCMPDSILGCGLVGARGQGCSGDTLVVADDGDGDYPTIQAALDSCDAWDVIELLDGTFTGDGNRDISFPQKPVTIRSRSGDPSACEISGWDMPPGYHFGFCFEHGNGQEAMIRDVGMVEFHSLALGGALQCPNGSPRIAGCLITGNSANDGGGALYCDSVSSPLLVGCTLAANHAPLGGGIYCGGEGQPVLQSSIVAFSPEGVAVYCGSDSIPVLSCCDLYGNDGGDWSGCIADQGGLRGNLCLDPYFCDAEEGDYTLWNYTPCMSEMCGQVGALGFGC